MKKKIRELEDEKEAVRRELWKSRGKPPEILGLLFIPYGAIAFILSVLLNSLTLSYTCPNLIPNRIIFAEAI